MIYINIVKFINRTLFEVNFCTLAESETHMENVLFLNILCFGFAF